MQMDLMDEYALISRVDGTMTYRQLGERLSEMCGEVRKYISERRLCLLVADHSMESILLYLMCIQFKMPLLLVDERNMKNSLSDLIKNFLPAFVWLPSKYEYDRTLSIECRDRAYSLRKRKNGYLWFLGKGRSYFMPSELALLISTSGSMGGAKYVCLSYENLLDNAQNIVKSLNIERGERAAVMLPISYSYGLSVVNTYLYQRGTLLIGDAMMAEREFWEFLRLENVNALCGVPYTYEIMDKLGVFQKKIKSLKKMTQAGGKLKIEKQRYFAELARREGFDFYVMYGQTEATARMSCFCLSREMDKLGSVGKAIPGGRFSVAVDEDGRGEIIYFGKNVFLGYARESGDFKDLRGSRELYTGDVGFLDDDGYLFITGRKKRFVKIRGFRIELDLIQEEMRSQTDIEVICVKEKSADRMLVFSLKEIQDGYRILSDLCHQLMTKESVDFFVLDEFPRNANGKIAFGVLENWEEQNGED